MEKISYLTKLVVLAGGKSSRFGSNKALAPWGEKTFIEVIVEKLKNVTQDLAISVRDPSDYQNLQIEKVEDLIPGIGPIGALYSCIKKYKRNYQRIMMIACDMPLINVEIIKYMLNLKTLAPIVIPEIDSKKEPLHAIYHCSLEPLLEHLIKEEDFKLNSLISMVPIRKVKEEELKQFCNPNISFTNINTQKDFEKIPKKFLKNNSL